MIRCSTGFKMISFVRGTSPPQHARALFPSPYASIDQGDSKLWVESTLTKPDNDHAVLFTQDRLCHQSSIPFSDFTAYEKSGQAEIRTVDVPVKWRGSKRFEASASG